MRCNGWVSVGGDFCEASTWDEVEILLRDISKRRVMAFFECVRAIVDCWANVALFRKS
jgi:hypothetical protein